jgi:uncharacterized protein YbaP (TraB family)
MVEAIVSPKQNAVSSPASERSERGKGTQAALRQVGVQIFAPNSLHLNLGPLPSLRCASLAGDDTDFLDGLRYLSAHVLSRAMTTLVLTLASALFLAPASAAPPLPPVQDWSVETVVVTAHVPGPAFWHIAKGKSEIFILGEVQPLPGNLKWDSRRLEQILTGANALLLPPRGNIGMVEGLWFLIWNGDLLRLPDGQQLESALPSSLRGRFVAARNAIGRDADRYATDKPSVAGFRLEGDFIKARSYSLVEPAAAIEHLAERLAIPTRHIANYPALDVVKEVPTLNMAGNLRCLSDALDDIATMSAHAAPAAQAWADGDLDAIKAHYSEPKALDCLGQSASFNKLWERSVADSVHAIDTALAEPGKTVAVISIGDLLRKNGVIDRLKAQGFTIEGPGD